MEYSFGKGSISIKKEFSSLDKFVFEFVKTLDGLDLKYVIISGYIPILFGRSRETEDVDLFLDKIPFEKFKELWLALEKEFECINAVKPKEAYEDFLLDGLALRFSLKNTFIPNIELKFPKSGITQFSLDNRVTAIVNGKRLFISNLELQIAFKLYLGSEKDMEDAIHLWTIFKGDLDKTRLKEFAALLKVTNKLRELDEK